MTAIAFLIMGFIMLFIFLALVEERKGLWSLLPLVYAGYCFAKYATYVI